MPLLVVLPICQHTVFQDISSSTCDGILQGHIVRVIRTFEFADVSVICVEILNSLFLESRTCSKSQMLDTCSA
jgi:hypothetical protein